tara:strand:- start:36743 stop:37078 length:336 start_codon:yes stop_codon:yes gene_type:complete
MHSADYILDERKKSGRREFLIRWTNYSARFDSWSDEVSQGLMQTWERRRGRRKWSKMLPADSIQKTRGSGIHKEFLVKFCEGNELQWTPFVSQTLIDAWAAKTRIRMRRKS